MQSAAIDAAIRFGIDLAGIKLLTPVDRPAQYIASAAIYPLPLAPRRVRGMTQVRGHPVTVVEAGAAAPVFLPTFQRHALLIVGDPTEAPMAFLVDAPPHPVRVADFPGPPNSVDKPDVVFADALSHPQIEVDGLSRTVWWQADFSALFEAMMTDR